MGKSSEKIPPLVCQLSKLVRMMLVLTGGRLIGTSLVKFGQGMCRLAALQETQALTFKDGFFASLKMYHDEIKEYHVQRKKLESRRSVD